MCISEKYNEGAEETVAIHDVYTTIRLAFQDVVNAKEIQDRTVTVSARDFDAAGSGDLHGKEIKLTGEYEGAAGECFTSFPGEFNGTIAELMALDIEHNPVDRSVYIAGINAVLNKYELADDCLSCDEADRKRCASRIVQQFKKNNGKVNCLLVGYQEEMAQALSEAFPLRILDLDQDNIGREVYGVLIEDGATAYQDASRWAEVIVCTGSAFANGTIYDYIKLPKDVQFYGTTIAGAARILELRRICPFGKNQ